MGVRLWMMMAEFICIMLLIVQKMWLMEFTEVMFMWLSWIEFRTKRGAYIFVLATQEWEIQEVQAGWLWNEGPSVIKVNDLYYMTYSGNPYYSFEYAIGVATSDSPIGPFEKYEHNPVVPGDKDQEVSGPRHSSIFRSHD